VYVTERVHKLESYREKVVEDCLEDMGIHSNGIPMV
jgi:hypothetical protein